MSDHRTVFEALKAILEPYAAQLDRKRDCADELYVDTRHVMKNGKPLFFGAVRRGKSSVSFHLMPVYVKPALLDSISPELRKRMHGKSCFQFNRADPDLFAELAALTEAGYASYREHGFLPS